MTPELVFIIRLALLCTILMGLEFIFAARAEARRKAPSAAPRTPAYSASQANPVVRLQRGSALGQISVRAVRASAGTSKRAPVTGAPIVRLEPLPHRAAHTRDDVTTEKRAA